LHNAVAGLEGFVRQASFICKFGEFAQVPEILRSLFEGADDLRPVSGGFLETIPVVTFFFWNVADGS